MPVQHSNGDAPQPVDASASVFIDPDNLTAYLLIEPAENGGADFTPALIDQALRVSKVSYGINEAVLAKLRKEPIFSQKTAFARGTAAVGGEDGEIHYHFRTTLEARPREREDGTVDYRELGIIENAHKDQVLCTIKPPTPGTEGMNVYGQRLMPRPGKPVPSPKGKNTFLSEDATQLLAAVDGQADFLDPVVNVTETYTIQEDVDTSTGNIQFVGNVRVLGNLMEDFSIESGGSVEVCGMVQGGHIKAKTKITVRGGVVGMGKSRLVCGDDLSGSFLENCDVFAAGSVRANSIMNCTVQCGREVKLSGLHARLIGGRCVVGGDIIAESIGSPANLPTVLVLGTDPTIVTQHSELGTEIRGLRTQLRKLGQIITLLENMQRKKPLPEARVRLLETSRDSLGELTARLKASEQAIHAIDERILHSETGKIVCRGIVYPGTKITIGFEKAQINEPVKNVCFLRRGDKIAEDAAPRY